MAGGGVEQMWIPAPAFARACFRGNDDDRRGNDEGAYATAWVVTCS